MPSATFRVSHHAPDDTSSCRGFTLVEMLVVIGIIAVLAAIIFPVFAVVREKSRQTTCASNLRQLGIAVSLYVTDSDEQHLTAPSILKGIYTNQAWAGRISPYLKTPDVLHCPSDATNAIHFPGHTETAYPVSYAMNMNLSLAPSVASLVAPARTVLAVEVQNSHALVTLPQEGGDSAPQCSPATNGVNSTLIDVTGKASLKMEGTTFATGYLDNYEWTADEVQDQYKGSGRHSSGANYLAADGHTVWLKGTRVSAGGNPPLPASAQSKIGCRTFQSGPLTTPCAEGTSVGQHPLTFSVR